MHEGIVDTITISQDLYKSITPCIFSCVNSLILAMFHFVKLAISLTTNHVESQGLFLNLAHAIFPLCVEY